MRLIKVLLKSHFATLKYKKVACMYMYMYKHVHVCDVHV